MIDNICFDIIIDEINAHTNSITYLTIFEYSTNKETIYIIIIGVNP